MAETFYWGVEATKALISLWGNDNIRRILEGKTKKNQLAYQQVTERMNSEHNFPSTKTQVISKIKYLKGQYTQAKNKDRSRASRDDMIRCCPYLRSTPTMHRGKWPFSGIPWNDVTGIIGIGYSPGIHLNRKTSSYCIKIFPSIKPFRYDRSNRKTLLVHRS